MTRRRKGKPLFCLLGFHRWIYNRKPVNQFPGGYPVCECARCGDTFEVTW